MAKQVSFNTEKVLKGLNLASDVVKSTLGPKGRNVGLSDPSGVAHEITNDGVFIANQIKLEDREEDFGAWLIRNATSATNDDAGDGTTGTAVLTQATIQECLKRPENEMDIKTSLFEARDEVVEEIKKVSRPVKTDEQIRQIATISAESEKYGDMITEIIKKVGRKGTITLDDSRTFDTHYEIVEGYEANVGFTSPYFITNKEKASAEFEKVYVAVFQSKISTISDIKYLGDILKINAIDKLVIVCQEIESAMHDNFVANHLAPVGLKNVVVRAGHADLIRDIASSVGATVIGGEAGVSHENMTLEHLGFADKVIVKEKKSIFFRKGCKTAKAESKRLEELSKGNTNEYEKAKYLERASKLKGDIAVIKVGAKTDLERRYLKKKLEDAVNATQSAIEEGVVEGGGMTLYRIAEKLKGGTIGKDILKKVLTAPLKTIIENSGKDYAEIIKNIPDKKGYDAKNDENVNMFEKGIIDPSKVVRCAVENAVGTAGIFITMPIIITDIVEKND